MSKKHIFNQYVNKVLETYELDEESLFEKNSKRRVSEPRHMLYYLCYKRNMKLITIQELLEDRGYITKHQPIKHGVNVIAKKIKEDQDYKVLFDRLKVCETT